MEVRLTPVPTKRNTRETLMLQTPIIVEKRNTAKSMSANRMFSDRKATCIKRVEPFVPVQIPTRDRNKVKL